jgi:asparagine synthase (glutamine-hydrolysing)
MCGIYGISSVNRNFIEEYMAKCQHRGPDGQDVYSDANVTLGHNLLSITDMPELSRQPWLTPKGNILIYNGEIFNYAQLVKTHKDFAPRTLCDTELLAWGLDKFGLDFVKQIDSMHGFAYYNKQDLTLTLSRDHAGIKPLYYAETGKGFVFGSEIKGMLPIVENSDKIDPYALSCMAYTGLNATSNTFFTNIKKLMCGESLTYSIAKKKIVFRTREVIKPTDSKNFIPEEFREEVRKSVSMCTLGRRKIATFLSGGLDSGIIAYELKQLTGEALCYTNKMEPNVVWREDDHNDDYNKAKTLSKRFGFDQKTVVMTPELMCQLWDDSINYMEQPVYNPSMVMYYYTNKFVSQDGVVVTMAGDMGDEVLGGYPKYWKLRNKNIQTWEDLVEQWMNRIKRPILFNKLPMSRNEIKEHLVKNLPNEVFNPDDKVNSYMALDCVTQVPEEFFIRNDTYGMAFSMEGRFPLATKSFMNYAMSIHSDSKIGADKSDTKLLTKIAYKDIFPNEIVHKHKTGWTAPVKGWVNLDERCRKFYDGKMHQQDCLSNLISESNYTSKSDVPAWILRDWARHYDMSI